MKNTKVKSMYSQAVSRVSLFPLQEKGEEQKMTDISGTICSEQYARFARHTLWQKMFVDYLVKTKGWYSSRCALTWKIRGTKSYRVYCQLQASMRPTEETECGLLRTPTRMQTLESPESMQKRAKKNGYKNGTKYSSLHSQIVYGILPTPLASDGSVGGVIGKNDRYVITKTGMPRKITQQGVDGSVGLARLVKISMLPTPTAQASRGNASTDRGKKNLTDEVSKMHDQTGETSQLNPQFVEEMMGYPENWTLLPFLDGEPKA